MNAINNDAAKPSDLPEKILHYINGEFVESIDGEEFDVVDPVTNQTYITAASGKPQDIDRAVAAAKEAFDNGTWSNALPRERARVLNNIADVVETRAEKLAAWESFDSGLP
ncbi:aldehyde dehydrogenase family protein, partial [Salmonella enterica]